MNPFQEYDPREKAFCSIGAAIIGGVAGIGSAVIGSSAAQSAAEQQAAMGNNAINAQRQMFDISQGQLQPFIDAGKGALPSLTAFTDPNNASSPLAALMRLAQPGPDQNATLAQTPGYQFSLDQGLRTVDSGLAARGLAGPGGALARGGANYAEGLAGTQWQNILQGLLSSYQTGAGTLQNVAGLGGNAAQGLAGAAGQTGQGIASNMVGIGNAQAAGTLGSANAISGGINTAGNAFSNAMTLNTLRSLLPGGNTGGLYGSNNNFLNNIQQGAG